MAHAIATGDRVVVCVRTPGIDALRVHAADDRNYDVLTVRDGRIVALRRVSRPGRGAGPRRDRLTGDEQ